jgi:nicotinamidase-related amidase
MIAARPFDYPYDGNLVPRATALIVIDMQVFFLAEHGFSALHGYDVSGLRAIIPNVVRLVAAARAAGLHIVWTRHGYRADLADRTPYEAWRHAEIHGPADRAPPLNLRGTPGFAIIPELPTRAGEPIIDKSTAGAFCYTDLDPILRARAVSHLIVTGCTTDVCVHTTLREACDRNYQCALVEDACASGDSRAHEAAIYMTTVEHGIWGVVTTTKDVIEGLRRTKTEKEGAQR